ncbi:hypothetical protein [Allosediminivita pacifica]|uniref:Uncharacterized protein n=1 Tax=Allosediminivita pacifica TaxID=1267769 RepID=A0A2T6ANS9_9RHOB|nr:hypothetical protein [Allosediminivita pacifica]PTX45491.1 hypothetical protein C8N44_12112 [Allosediminivita pacifica]GGB19866.1 hypothetical protein GCM10011324_32440 [Allosediminivita pacifica]
MPGEELQVGDPWEAVPGTERTFAAGPGGRIEICLARSQNGLEFSYGIAEGVVDRESLSAATRHLISDPRLGARRPTLWDLRHHDFDHTPVVRFRGYAFIFSEFPERSGVRRGYLVSSDTGYGMMRMFQLSASGYGLEDEARIRVSADAGALVTWLQA